MSEKISLDQVKNDSERLEIEKAKFQYEQRFWNKNFGVVLTAVVSLIGILFLFGQVEIAIIQKDKELEVAKIQEQRKFDFSSAEYTAQQRFERGKFINDLKNEILSNDVKRRKFAMETLLLTFNKEELDGFLSKIQETTASSKIMREIQAVRHGLISGVPRKPNGVTISYGSEEAKSPSPSDDGTVWDDKSASGKITTHEIDHSKTVPSS